jgi:hypothetical protein
MAEQESTVAESSVLFVIEVSTDGGISWRPYRSFGVKGASFYTDWDEADTKRTNLMACAPRVSPPSYRIGSYQRVGTVIPPDVSPNSAK